MSLHGVESLHSPEARQAEQDEFFANYFDETVSEIVEALLPHKSLIREKQKLAGNFFSLMEVKYGGSVI